MQLTNALWITLIGMGLVFIAILLLWGLMALLVRLTAEREEAPATAASETLPAPEALAPADDAVSGAEALRTQRRKAAAAAVAFALAAQAGRGPARARAARPEGQAGTLSAWQAVNRARQFSQKTITTGKKVVR